MRRASGIERRRSFPTRLGAKPFERDERRRPKTRRIAYSGTAPNKIQVFPRHRYVFLSALSANGTFTRDAIVKLLCKSVQIC